MSNIPYGPTYSLPTTGKQFYDTPPWLIAGSATYDWDAFLVGGQFKFTDARYVTAMNDLQVPSYVTIDGFVRVKLDGLLPGAYFQLNVNNLFDEKYIGSINYGATNNNNLPGVPAGISTYSEQYAFQGAPRTIQGTLHVQF